jgi:hypothetical protein
MAEEKKKAGEAAGKGAGEGAGKPAREKASRLTRSQVVAQHAKQGGLCYVSGRTLGNDFVEVGGVLICKAVNERRGGRSLGDFRSKLGSDLAEAAKLVEDFGRLRDKNGIVQFYAEQTPEQMVA